MPPAPHAVTRPLVNMRRRLTAIDKQGADKLQASIEKWDGEEAERRARLRRLHAYMREEKLTQLSARHDSLCESDAGRTLRGLTSDFWEIMHPRVDPACLSVTARTLGRFIESDVSYRVSGLPSTSGGAGAASPSREVSEPLGRGRGRRGVDLPYSPADMLLPALPSEDKARRLACT